MPTASMIELLAPLSGPVFPLESVPDPVFARRMLGDGVAIDPTSAEVLAPLAGSVSQLHRAHHAIAVTSDEGVEVLIHVGLDSVSLEGRGFTPLVAKGARVEKGQRLLRFDAEVLAARARSLLSTVTVTTGERVESPVAARGLVEAGRSILLTVALRGEAGERGDVSVGEEAVSAPVRVASALGLHARPAAVLADMAKRFDSAVRLVRGAEEANAKSVVAIMGLSAEMGDSVLVKARGPDAREAVDRLAQAIAEGLGEAGQAAPAAQLVPFEPRRAAGPGELAGAPASPGLALGEIHHRRRAIIAVAEQGGVPAEEMSRFQAVTREVARQIDALRGHTADASHAQILGVHLALLEDPELIESTEALLSKGKSAAFAWQAAFTAHAVKLEGLASAVLRERAADVRDVGRRVLALLAGGAEPEIEVPAGSILVAEELSPSEVAAFDPARVIGFATTTGGSTSHVAILARAKGIPAVCGVDEAALALPQGLRVVLDGTRGTIRPNPEEGYAVEVKKRIARRAAARVAEARAAREPAHTRCGHRVEVVANIRNAADARDAIAAGAEGVGLLRSEFLFDQRSTPPSEEEQLAAYRGVAEVLGKGRPLVVRTLDVGGDKPLPYLPLPHEENPFLGLRGLRISLAYPDLFRVQLRAILRAAPLSRTHLMFPMVSTLEEVRAAKQILVEEQRAVPHAVKVGVMIEVPSAAIIAEALARDLDFFSIGTNDLTQYVLAMDRNHPRLGRQADALHPAVLRTMALTIEGAHEHGKWVGVCGGIASDPLAVPVLVGLGVDELSVDIPAIAPVKATLSRWTYGDCADVASEALRLTTAPDVRALLQERAEPDEPGAARQVLP